MAPEQAIGQLPRKKKWVSGESATSEAIPIISERTDPAPGTHYVTYRSDVDELQIIHTAFNRKGFAMGALLAAEYIKDKKGIFTMKNVLGIGS